MSAANVSEQRAREVIAGMRMGEREKRELLRLWLRGEQNARFIVAAKAKVAPGTDSVPSSPEASGSASAEARELRRLKPSSPVLRHFDGTDGEAS